MGIAQIIESGVVVDAIVVDPAGVVSSDGSKITWPGGEFDAPSGVTLMMQAGAGIGWTLANGVLSAPVVVAPVLTVAQAQAYASAKANGLLGAMRSYTSGGVTLKSDATSATLADLMALAQWGAANETASQNWVANDYSVMAITGAQFVALSPLVGGYSLSVYAALASTLTGIAGGSITTTAEIDAVAWPV